MRDSEIGGMEVTARAAVQKMIDTISEALSTRFAARNGTAAPREEELHRGAFVVLKHYEKHPLRQAIFIRTMAFHMLIQTCGTSLLEKWCKPTGERREGPPHPALIEAVALVPTTGHGKFDTEEFFSAVERIANEQHTKAG